MSNIIHHRGPDDEGFVTFEELNSPLCYGGKDTPIESYISGLAYRPVHNINSSLERTSQIAFGHRRLSIIDLSSNGHQPMCSADGRYWITLNGEIYNYIEIREELKVLNHTFVSESDTEVVLAAYSEWGEACLNRFNGMWAFAIYDQQKKEIFLARDRYGIKPLYYWISPNNDFCFGSEIKQFTVIPGWTAKLNKQRAYDYLVYSLSDHTEETMFAEVYQIPPGHYFKSTTNNDIVNKSGKIHTHQWYVVKNNPFKGTSDEASSLFKTHFQNAVDLHLRADVSIGSALSGGLDSSAIVCQVNKILKNTGSENQQKTFSSCSKDERFDERKWMNIVETHTKMDSKYVYPESNDLFKLTPNILWNQDEPYLSQSVYLGYHVFELAKENQVRVLLNGQGADEYLGGYGQFSISQFAGLLTHFKWKSLISNIRHSKRYDRLAFKSISSKIFFYLLPVKLKRRISRFSKLNIRMRSLIDIGKLGALPIHPYTQTQYNHNNVQEISKFFTFFSPLPTYLHWEDRNSMAHSIEARVPFLDFRLVEFCYNLPDSFLNHQGINKLVMRKGLKEILPEAIANRKDKMGFTTPEERWVRNDQTEMFRKKIEESISSSLGIIKPEALLYFDRVVKGEIAFDCTYWRLILFAEWLKLFNIENK